MDLEQRSINVGKALIMDTVRNANSGHTGGPLSSFDFAYELGCQDKDGDLVEHWEYGERIRSLP